MGISRDNGDSGTAKKDTTTSQRSRSFSRRSVLQLAGVGTVGALAGCLDGPVQNVIGGTDEPIEVTYRGRYKRVGLVAAVNEAGARMGPWEDQGLDVDYAVSGGGMDAAKAVANGDDEFGNGGFGAVLQLIEEGAPLKVIGVCTAPMDGVVAKTETGISDWKDLEGKTIGQVQYGSGAPVAKAAMRREGVDLSTISFQNIQPGSGVKLMIKGELDSVIRYVPQTIARLENEGIEATGLKSEDALGHLGVALYTRDDVIEERPELVDKFTKGWLNAFQVWASKFDEVLEMYKPLIAGDPNMDVHRKYLGPLYASQVPSKDIGLEHGKGWVSQQKMENTIDAFTDAELLKGELSGEKAYTNRFLEQNEDLAIETANTLYERLQDFDVDPDYM